jgi:hypothetical protein
MKHLIVIGIAVALLINIGVFFGLGFGSSALSVSGNQVATLPVSYNPQPFCVYENPVCYVVNFTTAWAGLPLITSLEPCGPGNTGACGSSTLSFGVNTYVANYPCTPTNDRSGSWNGGATNYGTSSYYVVSFSGYGTNIPTGTVNGVLYSGGSWGVSVNSSVSQGVYLSYCLVNTNLLGQYQSQRFSSPGLLFPQILQLLGVYPDMRISVTFYSQGQYCDGSGFGTQIQGACLAAYQNAGGLANNVQAVDNGPWSGDAVTTAVYKSAGASFSFVGQPYQNGGTITVSLTTGYDAGGYRLGIYCPAPRSCGGSLDPEFSPNPQTIPDNSFGYLVHWAIPSGAAQNNSVGPSWNSWLVVLSTQFAAGQISSTTIINPLYSPATPGVTWTNSGGGVLPSVGNTVHLTIYANGSALSGPATTVVLAVYYQPPGSPAQAEPGCGSGWVIGIPCPVGLSLPVSSAMATFTFVMNPPLGSVAVGITVYSGAANGQASPTNYFQIQISPIGGCGPASNPCKPGLSLWEQIGPYLLASMLVLGAVLAALLAPIPILYRFIIPVSVVAVLAVLLAIGSLQTLFLPHSLFNQGYS